MSRTKISLVLLLALLIEVQGSKASAGVWGACISGFNDLVGFGKSEVSTSPDQTLDPEANAVLRAYPDYAVYSPEFARFSGEGGAWRTRKVSYYENDEHGNILSDMNGNSQKVENGISVSFRDGRDIEFEFLRGSDDKPLLGITFTHDRRSDYFSKFNNTLNLVRAISSGFQASFAYLRGSSTLILNPDSQADNTQFVNTFFKGIHSFKSYGSYSTPSLENDPNEGYPQGGRSTFRANPLGLHEPLHNERP